MPVSILVARWNGHDDQLLMRLVSGEFVNWQPEGQMLP